MFCYIYITAALSFSLPTLLRSPTEAGVRKWTTLHGSLLDDIGYGVATDRSGSVYVLGSTEDIIQPPSFGKRDILLLKYDSSGCESSKPSMVVQLKMCMCRKKLWSRKFGTEGSLIACISVYVVEMSHHESTGDDDGHSVVTDSYQNIFILVTVGGEFSLASSGVRDGDGAKVPKGSAILKLDPNGYATNHLTKLSLHTNKVHILGTLEVCANVCVCVCV